VYVGIRRGGRGSQTPWGLKFDIFLLTKKCFFLLVIWNFTHC